MDWVGKVLIGFLCFIGIGLVVAIGEKIFGALKVVVEVVDKILEKLSKPFESTFEAITNALKGIKWPFKKDPIGDFALRHSDLGTKTAIITFMLSATFISVMTMIYIVIGEFGDYLMELFSMFPVFFVIGVLNGRVSFSVATLISTGVSSVLIGLLFGNCMKGYFYRGFFNVRRFVSIAYYLVTAIAACELGLLLSNVWDWLTDVGILAYNSAISAIGGAQGTIAGIFTVLGCVLAILFLLYIAVLLIGVAAKEYIESFTYGVIGFLAFFGLAFLTQEWVDHGGLNQDVMEWILLFVLICCVFIPDYLRVEKGKKKN